MTALLLVILVPALLLAWMVSRQVPQWNARPDVVACGGTAGREEDPGRVPKIVWSYWHKGDLPLVVQGCLRHWRRLNPDYEVNLVSAQNLFEFVAQEDLPASFTQLSPARQSDWLRLYFLRRYGGIWLDASIILTRSLDWLLDAQAASRAHYVGFYLQRYTVRQDCPAIDSWCMAAPKGSRFVADWLAEFSGDALARPQAYLDALGEARERIVQKIASPLYMTIHVTAQAVLDRRPDYRLQLIRAEDSAYFLQTRAGRWKRAGLFAYLLFFRKGAASPPLIKLRGGERKKLEPYVRRGLFTRASIVGTCMDANLRR